AEDGIRDLIVTGVQTCALPIWPLTRGAAGCTSLGGTARISAYHWFGVVLFRKSTSKVRWVPWESEMGICSEKSGLTPVLVIGSRSEERRVGKECRCGEAG